MRVLARRPGWLRVRLDDEDGNLVDAAVDTTVRATVRRRDGTVVLAETVATREALGVYRVELPAQTQLDLLDVEWTARADGDAADRTIVDTVEVVGGRIVELWRLREDGELANLAGEHLRRVVETVEDVFTAGLGFPPIPRPFRAAVPVSVSRPVVRLLVPGLVHPIELYSVLEAGATVVPVASVTPSPAGWLERSDVGLWTHPVDLWGAWGWAVPLEDVRRAAVTYARHVARASNVPDRATQIATEGAVITLSIPTSDRPTGLPEVDATLMRHRASAVI